MNRNPRFVRRSLYASGPHLVDDSLKTIHNARLNHIRLGCQPSPVERGGYHAPMKLKPILAANLKVLMEARNLSQMELHRRSKVSQSTVGRILRQAVAADLDTLAALARALDLDPWQLLIPNLDPREPPALQPISIRERELYQRLRLAAEELAKHKP